MTYTDDQVLQFEQSAKDVIAVRRAYLDIVDNDFPTALLLSQIRYWHLPSKEGDPKMRVKHDDKLWIVKKREDWWDEIRITAKQFDRSLAKLVKLGLVEKMVKKFSGTPTLHIRAVLSEIHQRELLILTAQGISTLPAEGISTLPAEGKTIYKEYETETTTENTDLQSGAAVLDHFPEKQKPKLKKPKSKTVDEVLKTVKQNYTMEELVLEYETKAVEPKNCLDFFCKAYKLGGHGPLKYNLKKMGGHIRNLMDELNHDDDNLCWARLAKVMDNWKEYCAHIVNHHGVWKEKLENLPDYNALKSGSAYILSFYEEHEDLSAEDEDAAWDALFDKD